MTRRIILAVVALAILAGLLYSSRIWQQPAKITGIVDADEIRIGSRVGGRVARVMVQEGQKVDSDQVLVELEPYDLQERRAEAHAKLAAARAEFEKVASGFRAEEVAQAKAQRDQLASRVDRLVRGPRPQEIAVAQARVNEAEAQRELAEFSFRRTSRVAGTGAATQEELDAAREARRSAEAQLVVRQQELSLLQEGTRAEEIAEAKAQLEEAEQAFQLRKKGNRQEEIDSAKASMEAAEATLAAIDQQIEELTIRAATSGTVEAIELQPGDLVAANAPVLSIMDTSQMWLRTYVPETHLDLEIGGKLPVTLDSFPDRKFWGRITFISRQAEFTPRNVQTPEERSQQVFRIKIELEDPPDELRPGMLADVWLEEPPE